MSYEINDRTLIEEMCGDIRNTAQAEYEKLKQRLKQEERDYLVILHFLLMKILLVQRET